MSDNVLEMGVKRYKATIEYKPFPQEGGGGRVCFVLTLIKREDHSGWEPVHDTEAHDTFDACVIRAKQWGGPNIIIVDETGGPESPKAS